MNLVRSHAAGVGEPLPVRAVRAAMALRANVLAKGYSGIRPETLDALLALLNAGVHPHVPSRGSVGASGDLAPLAHIALALVGEGESWDGDARRPAGRGAARRRPHAGRGPPPRKAWRWSTAPRRPRPSLALAVADAARLARAADIVAALTIDALRGSIAPFDARIHAARPHQGQQHPPTTCAGWSSRQPAQPLARQLRPGPGRLLDALRPASARRGPRRRRLRPPASSTSRPTPPPTTRWSSPTTARWSRAATSTARRSRVAADVARHRRGAAGDDQRAALGAAGQSGAERPAGVPHPPRRPRVGADAGAGHRRGAHLRAEDAGASGRASTPSRPRPTRKTTSA